MNNIVKFAKVIAKEEGLNLKVRKVYNDIVNFSLTFSFPGQLSSTKEQFKVFFSRKDTLMEVMPNIYKKVKECQEARCDAITERLDFFKQKKS